MKEQYEMPALTEQDRELVIALIHGDTMCMTADDEAKAMHLRDSITLAALNAEPKAWIVHAHGGDQLMEDGDYVANAEGMHSVRASSLYNAPSVPALKPVKMLPDINPAMFNADVIFGYKKGKSEAIRTFIASGYEVKE